MNVFEFHLRPLSTFATELQGDCLFGQVCWQLAQDDSLCGSIESLLQGYDKKPFLIVSDPCFSFYEGDKREYLLKRPFFPAPFKILDELEFKQERLLYDERKKRKSCRWVIVSKTNCLNPLDREIAVSVEDVRERYNLDEDWQAEIKYRQSHNSIDRYTGTTGTGAQFAPFTRSLVSISKDVDITLFIGVADDNLLPGITQALRRIGVTGYGADASTGKGQFELVSEPSLIELAKLGDSNPDSLYLLSAAVPVKDSLKSACFEPFTRFGRHGSSLATSNWPFKQPVLKAAAGAVFVPVQMPSEPYVGQGLHGLSKFKSTVEQGYSLCIPVKVEANDDC